MGSTSRLASVLTLALSAAWASTTLAQQGPPDGLAVRILNTPLPVTGAIGIMGNVNAVQSGPWSVNAVQSGTWNVNATINNTNPTQTINISQVASNVIHLHSFTHRGGSRSDIFIKVGPDGRNAGVFTVPAGQQLLITQIDLTLVPVPELTQPFILIDFGHNTPAGIAAGSFPNIIEWTVPTPAAAAAHVWQQRTFNPGFAVIAGEQLYYDTTTETEMEIYGYLTPAN